MGTEPPLSELYVGELCFWCDSPLIKREKIKRYPRYWHSASIRAMAYTRDHFIPKSKGGKGFTVPCCQRCNWLKGSTDPIHFRNMHRPNVPMDKINATLQEAKFAQAPGRRPWLRNPHDAAAQSDKLAVEGATHDTETA